MMNTPVIRHHQAMLDYLLRRETTSAESEKKEKDVGACASALTEADKQSALLEAEKLAGDEPAAVAFILSCVYADARLRAAGNIYTKLSLETVLQAMRKVDRRVAKLMQNRLDAIAKQDLIAKHAEECLASAQRLLHENPLMPNRVAEIDRAWRSIGEASESHQARFKDVRAELDARLAAQTALQRSVIDALEGLRRFMGSTNEMPFDQRALALSKLEQEWARHGAHPEFTSLPKHLVAEFEQAYQRLMETPLSDEHAEGQSQDSYEPVINPVNESTTKKAPKKQASQADLEQVAAFQNAMEKLEQAIQSGHLQAATEQDEVLRKLEKQLPRSRQVDAARLARVRAGLKRLQGWARWSGNVSREELIQSLEAIPGQNLPLPELAKAVSTARDRWKALDVQSGSATKMLWERFDAACTVAYAPMAEHSKKQALARQQNKERAEALVGDAVKFVESSGVSRLSEDGSNLDWKRIASFYQGITQSWQRIGHMDRKDKKRLDAAYEAATRQLLKPLRERWVGETEKRERLIREVERVDANDRRVVDKVRAIQHRWQECAKAMPLEHKTEQVLWARFRKACDAVFAQRKSANAAADAERKKNADSKLALCARLEAAQGESEAAIKTLLRTTEAAWKSIGAVPRAQEQQIEARYRKASAVLQERLKMSARAAKDAQREAWIEKIALCRAVESALLASESVDDAWNARWQQLPLLKTAREALMRKRFQAALQAMTVHDQRYVKLLASNRDVLLKTLLRAEIMAGVESPPELAHQRLQAQVEVLQSSLSGMTGKSLAELVEEMSALPTLADEATMVRLLRLLGKVSVE